MHSAIHVRGRFWYSLYVSKLHGNIYTLTFNLICFLDGEAKLVVRITPKVVIVTKAVILWCDHNNKTYTDLTITMFLLCVCSAIYWQFYLNYVPYWLTTEMGECRGWENSTTKVCLALHQEMELLGCYNNFIKNQIFW